MSHAPATLSAGAAGWASAARPNTRHLTVGAKSRHASISRNIDG
jgi:hypothetical protein